MLVQDDTGLYMQLKVPKNVSLLSNGQKIAVVTGGVKDIGKCIAEEFRKQDVRVYAIDKKY